MSEHVKVGRRLTWAQNAIETIYGHNKSGQALEPGDVVTLDVTDSTATEVAFNVTVSANDKAVMGMAIENIADNGYGQIQTKGTTAVLKVNGTTDIAAGDYLSTYTSAGIAAEATSGKGGVFAIALEAYATDDSNGVIDAWLMGGAGRFDATATSGTYADATFTGTTTTSEVNTTGTHRMQSTSKIEFLDTAMYIYSSADGTLDIVADTILNISAPSVHLIDAKVLKFGTSQDVLMQWDGTNFIIAAAADDAVFEIGDAATTQLSFDVKIYGGTASGASYWTFDAGADTLITTGTDIQIKDADLLNFGSGAAAAGDVSIWFDDDSGGLQIYPTGSAEAFTIGAASHVMNTIHHGTFTVGADGGGFDFTLYSDVANYLVWFDANGDTNGTFYFGADDYGVDVYFYGQAANHVVNWDCSADSGTGIWNFGADNHGVDVKFFGETASNYALWDESADAFLIVNTTVTCFAITSTLTGGTADNAAEITVTDSQTNASGYARGLYINTTAGGTKTGSGEHNALGVDVSVTGNTTYAYIESLYLNTTGNPTIALVSGISIYVQDLGTATANMLMLDLQTGNPTASAATTREAYMRCRNHGTGTPTSVMFLQANNNAQAATYFIEQDTNTVGPVIESVTAIGSGTNTTHRVKCVKGSTVFYLLGVAAS